MRYLIAVLVFSMLLFGAGCTKPKTGDVEGTLTVKGNPLKMARLHILASDGTKHVVPITNGKYTAKDIPVGPVKFGIYVEAVVFFPNGLNPPKSTNPLDRSNMPVVETSLVPDGYENPENSGLTGTVNLGKNTINLEIK